MTTESFEIHGGSQDGRVFEFVIPFRPLTFSMDGHERYCLNPDNASFGLVAPDADLVIHKDERDVRFGSLDVPDDGMIDSTDAFCEMTEAEIDNAFGKENADRAADAARRAIDRGLKQSALESRLAEAEKERDALSARVRELEGALGPFIEPNVDLIGEPGTVGSVVTLEQFARAARALKGTT